MPGGGKPPMTVLIEAEKGYTMHDRVIRPSKVVVAAPT
jgi:molecular chaperone GrpE